jgi:hypothetical protein
MLKSKNNFEIINSFFLVRPRNFQTTLVGLILYFVQFKYKNKNIRMCPYKIVHDITRLFLWSSMMVQYIWSKQAEENWSLHQ